MRPAKGVESQINSFNGVLCNDIVTQEHSSYVVSLDEFSLADHCSFDCNSQAPSDQLGNNFGFTASCDSAVCTPFGPASKDDRNSNVSDVVKTDVVEDILAMLREEDRDHGSYVFVNVEGKCNTEDQVRALLGSVRSCVGTTWYAIIIAEADYLSDDRNWEDSIDGHAVHRHHTAGGRAMKVIVNRRVVKYCQKIEWTNRAVRIDLVFYHGLQSVGVSLLGAHFGHGAEGNTSVYELEQLIDSTPPTQFMYVSGDFNVEFRTHFQKSSDTERAEYLSSMMNGVGFVMGFELVSDTVTRIPSGLSALIDGTSLLDMAFVPSAGQDYAWATLEEKPGDHAFVISILRKCSFPSDTGYRGRKWRCSDEEAFQTYVASSAPSSFRSVDEFHRFIRDAMDEFDDHRSAKQRRRSWEPERLKELRRQLRLAFDIHERSRLQRKIFQIRVQTCKTNRLKQFAAELKAGTAKGKKSQKLYRIGKMVIDGQATCDHNLWSQAVDKEFESRWTQTSDYERCLLDQLGGRQEVELNVTADEIMDACAMVRKSRKRDTDGVCVRAIKLSGHVLDSLAPLIAKLVSSDAQMSELSLLGVVKAKLRGSITPDKTRGLVPQLCLLQITHNILLNRMSSALNAWSREREMKGLVLGSGKGGQTRDLLFCVSQALEKGRDRLYNSIFGDYFFVVVSKFEVRVSSLAIVLRQSYCIPS